MPGFAVDPRCCICATACAAVLSLHNRILILSCPRRAAGSSHEDVPHSMRSGLTYSSLQIAWPGRLCAVSGQTAARRPWLCCAWTQLLQYNFNSGCLRHMFLRCCWQKTAEGVRGVSCGPVVAGMVPWLPHALDCAHVAPIPRPGVALHHWTRGGMHQTLPLESGVVEDTSFCSILGQSHLPTSFGWRAFAGNTVVVGCARAHLAKATECHMVP